MPEARYRVEGAGPLLIYVAGLDGTGDLFYKQVPALARTHRVVTYRQRETGRFTYDDLTADLATIIAEQGEPRATLVGESFGGTVALHFALRFPALTERLVIVNSFPRFRGRARIKLAARLARAMPWSLTWLARASANHLGLTREGIGRQDRARFFTAVRTVHQDGYVQRLRLIGEVDLEEHLSRIAAPTLLIAGGRDLLIDSVREAHAMAALLPHASVKVFARAGHTCLLGDEVSLADLLAEWPAPSIAAPR
jgi:pimeloyl-ACP methyl ester carboxylesterase